MLVFHYVVLILLMLVFLWCWCFLVVIILLQSWLSLLTCRCYEQEAYSWERGAADKQQVNASMCWPFGSEHGLLILQSALQSSHLEHGQYTQNVCLTSCAAHYETDFTMHQFRCSIVVSIPACHTADPGSIPGGGVWWMLVFFQLLELICPYALKHIISERCSHCSHICLWIYIYIYTYIYIHIYFCIVLNTYWHVRAPKTTNARPQHQNRQQQQQWTCA